MVIENEQNQTFFFKKKPTRMKYGPCTETGIVLHFPASFPMQ